MPRTTNRNPGVDYEDEATVYETTVSDPAGFGPGGVRYDGTAFVMEDASGQFDPRTGGGGGITEPQHKSLDVLVHNVAEPAYTQWNRTSGKVQSVIIWDEDPINPAAVKIRAWEYTRNPVTTGKVESYDRVQYDGAGTAIRRLRTTLTRSSGKVVNATTTEETP